MKTRTLFLNALLFLFVCTSSAFAATTTEDAADFLVKAGEYALKGGDIQSAIHEFSKALMLNPDHIKAKAYLSTYNLKEGIYKNDKTREAQLANMAHDIRDYKDDVSALKSERLALEKRVMLLEDVIERKGDHKLLKDLEDYYRVSGLIEVDETLPRNEQLVALRQKHKDFLEYAFDKDRVQEKYLDVMEELLGYREEHLEDSRNDVTEYQVALAKNRKELLFRMEQLKQLSKEYNNFRYNRFYDVREIEYLQEDLTEANLQVEMLLAQRQLLIHRLHGHAGAMREAL